MLDQHLPPCGYSTVHQLGPAELNLVNDHIHASFYRRIQDAHPDFFRSAAFPDGGLSSYHTWSHVIEHSSLWRKQSRVLSKSFADMFLSSEFIAGLRSNFGYFEISDEEGFGFPNFVWRLVRPYEQSDVGPVHRDSWFWNLNESFPKPAFSFKRIKVWIAINCEKGKSGLSLEPFSQLRSDIRFHRIFDGSIYKPVIDTENSGIVNLILVSTEPGQSILFHDDLLHAGALNMGNETRVSMEFTMLVRVES